MYAPSSSAFKVPPRVEHTCRDWALGRNLTHPCPKKLPASVDLQASKKSKGLQEQQSHCDSNMPALRSLTISNKLNRFRHLTFGSRMNTHGCISTAANSALSRSSSDWIE